MKYQALVKNIQKIFTKKNLKRLITKDFWWQLLKRHHRKIFWAVGAFILLLVLISIFTYIYFAGDLKDKTSITSHSKTGLTLLDDQGKPFFTFYHPKEVTYIPLSDMPTSVQQAVITAEDKNFYTNPGFSVRGMARAFVRNLLAGQIVEGGSTISQELVKNALLNSSRNILRKYQELVLATELNRRFSKQDILEMYLNSVYFGEGAFGVENAAETYFGIHAKELSLSQSALLVGLLPAPSALSPLSNDPAKALAKRNIVLQEMVQDKNITAQQADQAEKDKLVYNTTPKEETNVLAPHFALYVKNLLIKEYGEERVVSEGFRVKTTLNSTWQAYAEKVVKNQVLSLARNKATNGAAVVIDPKTGNIKVMVGSYDWNDETNGKINMALAPRQPGSSFKPIIYADALEQKLITPVTILKDNPIAYGDYKPLDYDKRFRGDVTVRRALANSLNIPAVAVMNQVGVPSGLATAKKFGITTLGDDASKYGLSLVLGSGEVKLLEMTDAYASFADEGVYHAPNAILEIQDKYGKNINTQSNGFSLTTLFNLFNPASINSHSSSSEKIVISDATAFLISSILSDNNTRAEEFGGALTISRPAAVKTGTTNDFRDALTIGYTPSIVVGVWVGNNDNSPMDNIAGSLGAAPIWRSLMETFLARTRLEPFIKPASVVKAALCLTPGNIASTSAEFFIQGTEPKDCTTPTPSPTKSPSSTPNPTPSNQPTETPVLPTNKPQPTQSQTSPTTNPTPTGIITLPSITPLPT
ncbi:MAG TPA: PBP1A family penicillin-binding protein [Methylomirabilota bacterium]|nr:PBP1A family penicillin-binding protein [Methylomirabilota bacterium]